MELRHRFHQWIAMCAPPPSPDFCPPSSVICSLSSDSMRVLAIITARGGSKGIPRKNMPLLGGKPLLQYTAEAALAAKQLERVILSTEDEEIAQVGKICGLEVPFLRPPELARDDTPTLPVLQHAVNALEKTGARFDAICLLQPTAPLRQSKDIDACINLLAETGAEIGRA